MRGAVSGESGGGPDHGRTDPSGHADGLGSTPGLFDRLLLPIADEADAENTCTAIRPHVDARGGQLVFVHVVEKTPGYPDKVPLDAARDRADAIFRVVRSRLADAGSRVSTEVRYGPNVVEEIYAAAAAVDATAIVITPRPARRWTRVLTGDVAYRLVTTSRHPVVVFPRPDATPR